MKILQTLIIFVFLLSALCQCGKRDYVTSDSVEALNYYKKGEEFRLQLYLENALKNYLNALNADSNFAMAAFRSALAYYHFGAEDSGKYYFEKALQLTPKISEVEGLIIKYYWAIYHDDEKLETASFDSLLRFYSDNFEVRVINAQNKWKNLDFEGARKIYQDILRYNPNYIVAYNDLGYLYAREGLFKESIDYLEKYKRYAASQLNPYDSLAEIYIAIGRYYEAIHMLEYIIENRQDELTENEYIGVVIYIRIADAYKKLGQYQKALNVLSAADNFYSSDYSLTRIALARFNLYKELNQIDQMETVINYVKSINPGDDYSYSNAIIKIEKMEFGHFLNILARYKSELENQDKIDQTKLVKKASIEGELNFKTGLFDEAAEQFKLAADTFSDTLWAVDLRLNQYISEGKAGNYTTALNGLRKIIKVNPNCPKALIYAAEFYTKIDKESEAKAYISHFHKLWKNADPGTPLLNQADTIARKLNLLQ
jgi:tetratricopeptide (TPR) repeat protein